MHTPVMVAEAVELLGVERGGFFVDGTVGSGGHAAAILSRLSGEGILLGIDRDPQAIERTAARLSGYAGKCILAQGNFRDLESIVADRELGRANGLLLDLGVSAEQLEDPARGFSFSADGPLDMRMDRAGPTAADLVNGLKEEALAEVLYTFGEERQARGIARAIARERERAPIASTRRLAELVERVCGRRGRTHPATRTFQALRIAVNAEIDALERGLNGGLSLLAEGGRMVVISFHSLEDRRVKRFFAAHAGRWESKAEGGRAWVGEMPRMLRVTRKPLTPSSAELAANPRARSAKLRAAERMA